jgi:peroxiredoxin
MNQVMRLSLIFIIFTLFSCSKTNEFDGIVEISGEIKNSPSFEMILYKQTGYDFSVVDTILLDKNDKFQYEVKLTEPGFYELRIADSKSIQLALESSDLNITYDFVDGDLVIKGSDDAKHMVKINQLLDEYQKEINLLNTAYYNAMSNNDIEEVKDIQDRAMNLEIKYAEKAKSLVKEMENSFVALSAIPLINFRDNFLFWDEIITSLYTKYPSMKLISNLQMEIEEMRPLSIGQVAPEISLSNPEGQMTNLSDLRGKYVLIDFWAAWCKPCREENPNVRRLYNQYQAKGFEVFGVSLDRTKDAWVKAIEEDQLPWTHVSDLKYFNSEAAALYKINAIPATYLLDPEGKIIAKDLRGMLLEKKMKEIFGE